MRILYLVFKIRVIFVMFYSLNIVEYYHEIFNTGVRNNIYYFTIIYYNN